GVPTSREVEVRLSGKFRHYLLISGGPVRDSHGAIIGAVMSAVDITAQKRTEQQLRDHGERLALAQAVSRCGMFDLDLNTRTIAASPAFEQLCGFLPGTFTGSLDDWFACLNDADRTVFLDQMVNAWSKGEQWEFEIRRQNDGQARWVAARGRVITGDRTLIGFLFDVTELRQARVALASSERRHRQLIDAVPIGLCLGHVGGEQHGLVTLANEAGLNLTGHTKQDLLEGTIRWTEYTPPEWREADSRAAEELQATGRCRTYEKEIWRKDGKRIPVEVAFASFGSGNEVVAFLRDITGQKQLQEQLRLREAEKTAIFNALPVGVAVVGRTADRWREVNPAWLTIQGFRTLEEMRQAVSTGHHRLFSAAGEALPVDEWPSSVALRTGNTLPTHEIQIRTHDGRTVPALCSAAPVLGPAGTVAAAVVSIMEMSQLKRAQETLRHRTEQLASSNEELQAFAYTASHDLQEPLRTIALYTELLERRCPLPEGPCLDFRRTIRANALRMQAMLASLLAYSQLSQVDRPKPQVDVNRVIDSVLRVLASAFREDDSIVFDSMPVVQAWEGRLEQVFQNLIGNALKYRKPGRPVHVQIGCKAHASEWLFQIRDDGIGFHMDYAERIFGIFKRLHGGQEYTGTGIGLTIVRRIVERHGGNIWAESREGEGSTFYFTLPRQD
ncbi:MAG TPA: PAS domain S-box protein, partial [Bryobacteraceae bacterium]|nr:PAS domain S-box protein [Bryobacteraceae bacterium]